MQRQGQMQGRGRCRAGAAAGSLMPPPRHASPSCPARAGGRTYSGEAPPSRAARWRCRTGGGSRSPRPPWRRDRRPPPRCRGSAEGTKDERRRGSVPARWSLASAGAATRSPAGRGRRGAVNDYPGSRAGQAAGRAPSPRCLLAPGGPGKVGQCPARRATRPTLSALHLRGAMVRPCPASLLGPRGGAPAEAASRLLSQVRGVRAPGVGSRTEAWAASRGGLGSRAGIPSGISASTPSQSEQLRPLCSLQRPVEAKSCLFNVADIQRTFHGALHQRLPSNLGCN